MATIYGTAGNDNPLSGTSGNDSIYGLAGDDRIITNDGDDYVESGDGDDEVNGYPTTGGAYMIYRSTGNKTIYGGNGNDFLIGGSGNNLIYGDAGIDRIYGQDGNDKLNGGNGNDTIYAGGGDDTVDGGDGDDYLSKYSEKGSAIIFGGAGIDTILGGLGNDTIDGGDGNDPRLQGYEGNDTISGGLGDDKLYGDTGDDLLKGGDGADQLQGGLGNDTLFGGLGNDTLYGDEGNDILNGDEGDDKLYDQTNGSDTLYGGDGNDTLSTYGSTGDDKLYGGNGVDELTGGLGNDLLDGGEGDDKLYGYEANDKLFGGNGNDKLYGGAGDYELRGDGGDDSLYDFTGNDTLNGGDGNDTLSTYGSLGNAKLYGGNGNDELSGGKGNDILDGGAGVDELRGYEGNDTYYVRDAYDYIYDSSGSDTAYVSASFVKIPSSIEKVIYTDGALALPYWIDALIPDQGAGLRYQSILSGSKVFYYAFPTSLPSYDTNKDHAIGYVGFSEVQIARTQLALDFVASVVDLRFLKTNVTAASYTINFASNTQIGSGGYAQYPSESFTGSDLFLNNKDYNKTLADGTYGANVLMHELGHALGLKHPFDEPDADGDIGPPPYLQGSEDSGAWTYMSYNHTSAEWDLNYSPLDIAALQYMYGPSKYSRTGNDTYKISSTSTNFIWDGAGTDTLDASDLGQGSTIYLTPGHWGFVGTNKTTTITSAGQVTVNFGSIIENLIGTGYSDNLFGTDTINTISGGAGKDSINGLGGNDLLIGGQGDDEIIGGLGVDTAQFSGTSASYSISASKSKTTVIDKRLNSDSSDTITSVERLKFSDKSIAIDLDGNAGISAKIIGAVLGKEAVKIPAFMGIGLSLLDGGMSYSDLGALALAAVGATTNESIASTVWRNIYGTNPTVNELSSIVKQLNDGLKPGDYIVSVGDSALNATNIGLVGLALTGIEFLPT